MRIIYLLLLLFFSSFCHALSIEGTWKSDYEQTMKFNRTYAKLTVKQEKLLSELMGHLTIIYKDGTTTVMKPDIQVTVNGKKRSYEGFTATSKYKIIGQTNDTIVFEDTDNAGEKHYSMIKFVNQDQYWQYVPNINEDLTKFHIREYFIRQK